jgi:hypothetical protein
MGEDDKFAGGAGMKSAAAACFAEVIRDPPVVVPELERGDVERDVLRASRDDR